MVMLYSASALEDTRIQSGLFLLRNNTKQVQRQHFQPRFTAPNKWLGTGKEDSFLGGKMQESILMCGAKCNKKLKDVLCGREEQRVWRCPYTADAPYQTIITNMEGEKKHSLWTAEQYLFYSKKSNLVYFLKIFDVFLKLVLKVPLWRFEHIFIHCSKVMQCRQLG